MTERPNHTRLTISLASVWLHQDFTASVLQASQHDKPLASRGTAKGGIPWS